MSGWVGASPCGRPFDSRPHNRHTGFDPHICFIYETYVVYFYFQQGQGGLSVGDQYPMYK
jgi:hypothetical protein